MKKNNTMKKNSFIQGAFIATLAIVITKIMGILYVIPFYAIIGEEGGALYGYAYTIYLVFMAISSAGIPLAMSKIISEYQTLGYYDAKNRAFKMGKSISLLLGFISFIVLFIFAKPLAEAILGDLTGGHSIKEVVFVIRVISTAILVVPILSVYRGYFEGHKFITPPSISQVLEQIVRVLIIVVGSYLALKVFNLSLTTTVGIAVFAATLGAFSAYIYLVDKKFKNKSKFKSELTKEEVFISNKEIFKKILVYAFPLIMIDIFKSLYSFIDTVTVVRTLGSLPIYTTIEAEGIMSILSTWGAKFNMIIISISTGLIVSLIPNLTSSFVLGKMNDVHKKINQTFQMLLVLIVPMTVGLSFLSRSVYTLFYGESLYGSSILKYYIFVALITCLFTTAVTICQVLKNYKTVFISLLSGVVIKFLLNSFLINLFYNIGFKPYYGSITATILGYLVSFIICLVSLKINYKVKYFGTIKKLIHVVCGTLLMVLVLLIMNMFIPVYSVSRIVNFGIIIFYAVVGMIVYFLYMWNFGVIQDVFGDNLLKKSQKNIKLLKKIIL